MNHTIAQTHINGGHAGKSMITPKYIESVAGKDRNARMNRTREV